MSPEDRDRPVRAESRLRLRGASKAVLVAACLAAFAGGRGLLLASLIDGRYPLRSWILDVIGLGTLVLALHGADVLLERLCARIVPRDQRSGRVLQNAVRVPFLIFVCFPFLLATLQIHPQRVATTKTPGDRGLPFEEVTIRADVPLAGWWIPNDDAKAIVLVAHGLNANRQNFLVPVEMLHEEGFAALIFDFRAHGDSGGRQSTLGLEEADDVRAAFEWIQDHHPGRPIHALGYSMGAAAVLTAAANHRLPFDRIVVDGTFSSIRSVADVTVLRFAGPLRDVVWRLGCFWIHLWTGSDLNRHRPVDRIRELDPTRLFLIHGSHDPVIPVEECGKLFEATGRRAHQWIVPGAGHVGTIEHWDYPSRVVGFFTQDVAGAPRR